jgi:HEAT repeat protein
MRYFYNRSKSARRRHRMRMAAQAGIVAAAVLAWSGAAAGTLEVSVRNGYVTMNALAVPLGDVLRDLSQKAGFRLVMKKELYAPVTWSFQDVPVEEAVTNLLARVSSIALYAPPAQGAGPLLTEVRILRGGNDDVPLVEHRNALAIDDGMLAGDARFDMAKAESPARTQIASVDGLQPASRAATPADPAFTDRSPADRRARALRAAKGPPDLARQALNTAISDPDTVVRQRGVQGLVRLGGEESVSSLSRVLLEDPAPQVRRMAASGLGRMNTESAFWALMEASSDSDQGVREAVSAALLRLERRGVNNGAG